MALQDLPPELFQGVIKLLIQEAGLVDAWKIRGVSRLFAAEIEFHIFGTQTQDAFEISNSELRGVLKTKMWLYLFYRTKTLLDAEDMLPNKVNEMMQWLCQQPEVHAQNQSEQDRLREMICKAVVEAQSYLALLPILGFVVDHLGARWMESLKPGLDNRDKLAAAAAIGNRDLVDRFLPVITPLARLRCQTFGTPLTNAAISNSNDVVAAVSEYMSQELRPFNYLAFQNSIIDVDFHKGLRAAMCLNNAKLVKMLLAFRNKHAEKWDKGEYNRWLLSAVESGHVEMVSLMMDLKLPSGPRVLHTTFDRACQLGYQEIVSALICEGENDRLGMPINETWRNWTPLLGSIRNGTADIVTMILDAGAEVDGITIVKNFVSPIEVAMKRGDIGIVRALIDRGASLEDLEVATRKKDVYNLLRGVRTRAGFDVPTYQKKYGRKKLQGTRD